MKCYYDANGLYSRNNNKTWKNKNNKSTRLETMVLTLLKYIINN